MNDSTEKSNLNKKAVILLSGGLDSELAAGLALRMGIELTGVNFGSVFFSDERYGRSSRARKTAEFFGIPFYYFDITEEFLKMIVAPPHGYGKNMNPCIDCKILMFRKAMFFANEAGASFLVTGEVLGERPMSQMKGPMMRIEKCAGLSGLVLRPLSGKLLPPTRMEEAGLIRREALLDISGRGRQRQMALAKEFGIDKYETPAGGCRLTDPEYAKRLRELMDSGEEFNVWNIRLLEFGRHFKLDSKIRLVVGRREKENRYIVSLAKKGDWILHAREIPGPVGLLRGARGEEDLRLAAGIVLRYSDAKDAGCWSVIARPVKTGEPSEISEIEKWNLAIDEGRYFEEGTAVFNVSPVADDFLIKLKVNR